ncbi:Periplasmic beta-glucosidase [Hypsibius exemplaris]|uniref:beta-glucosidase n=1 Tax=Hypsibius exemplaris TaxID=2072580 RepID=A0A1W0WBG4_HYPEX|nr:Periplasmic beta-glucosidase [Hypsibius exemplaris]
MRTYVAVAIVLVALGVGCQAQAGGSSPKLTEAEIENRINDLLANMTMAEKLGQLLQLDGLTTGEYRPEHIELAQKGLLGSTLNVRGARMVNELHNATMQSRLKIPILLGFDVIHGYRTLFPIPLGETASWDLEAVERASAIAAAEAASAGLHWTFAPMVDVMRDPRWGRVMEGSGEDVHLGIEMAKARIRGFQGTDYSQKDKVLACAKHFVGYGAAEGGRDYNTVDMSERRLREHYLPPFKASVEAGVGSFMTAFNDLNGVPATANQFLLRQILREEWKFDGLVISDYNAVQELINHGMAADGSEAAMYGLNGGTDMEMLSRTYVDSAARLVETGKVTLATIDTAVRHVLRIKFRLGLFAEPFPFASEELEQQTIKKPEFLQAARELAAKSFVLLKNANQILPIDLTKIRELVVIGSLADDKPNTLDWWAGDARAEDSITILQGLRDYVASANPANPVRVTFSKGCESSCTSDKDFAAAVTAVGTADIAVIVVGEVREVSGEAASLSNIDLSGRQLDLVKAIAETGKPYVIVLKNGRPLTIDWLAMHAPAILVTWHSGTMGGPAVADVLFGAVNPSGKLPMTFPRNVGQIPLYHDYKNTGRPYNIAERYTSKYMDIEHGPLYPFGFGLSYTTFQFSELKLSAERVKNGESVKVSVQVQNNGTRDGEEVVQLYLRDVASRITRPVRQLKAFRKLALKVNEKQTVEFTVTAEDMGFLDETWKMTIEAGEFQVFVGNSADAELMARFYVDGEPTTETTSAVPSPTQSRSDATVRTDATVEMSTGAPTQPGQNVATTQGSGASDTTVTSAATLLCSVLAMIVLLN